MGQTIRLVVFALEDRRYGLRLEAVEQIVRAAAVTPVPHAPRGLLGLLDLHGRVLPVLDLRSRLGLPPRDLRPADRFIVAHTRQRVVVLVVDEIVGLTDVSDQVMVDTAAILPGLEVEGAVSQGEGVVLIYNLEAILPEHDETELAEALSAAAEDRRA
ncbi:MAG: chemotaxis protein CheW [Armatimonadetes bacterium]|nr:chemotaxis protein CheW [Armatimonadota bacterium]